MHGGVAVAVEDPLEALGWAALGERTKERRDHVLGLAERDRVDPRRPGHQLLAHLAVEAGAAVHELDVGELLLDQAAERERGDRLEEGAGEADDAGLGVGAEEVQAGTEVDGDEVPADLAEPGAGVRDVRDVGELVAAEGEEFVLAGAEGAAPGGLGEEPLAHLGLNALEEGDHLVGAEADRPREVEVEVEDPAGLAALGQAGLQQPEREGRVGQRHEGHVDEVNHRGLRGR